MEQKDDRRAKKLAQVRALLDNAASFRANGNDEAADSYERKADEMMVNYAIEEAELRFARPAAEREKPVLVIYDMMPNTGDDEIDSKLKELFYVLIRSLGIIGAGGFTNAYKLVGWQRDIDYLDLLYTQLRLHMALTMNPKADPKLSFDRNVVMLKETGMKWERIYELMREAGFFPADSVWERRIGVKFTGIYTRYCNEHGLHRHYANPTVYRRSFMAGYVRRIQERLVEMKRLRDDAKTGNALVLHGMENDLNEFYYEMFPDRRPHPKDCECDNCHYVRCWDKSCKRPICKNKFKPVRHRDYAYKDPVTDAAAMNAGRSAANTADLGQTGVGGNSGEIK